MGEMYAANQDLLGRLDDRSDRYLLDVISVPRLDYHFAQNISFKLSVSISKLQRIALPAKFTRNRNAFSLHRRGQRFHARHASH